jgi:hypothetical protein
MAAVAGDHAAQQRGQVVHTLISGMTMAASAHHQAMAMPMTRIASSSSVTRITPICAVMAEPERPRSGSQPDRPSSWTKGNAHRMLDDEKSPP